MRELLVEALREADFEVVAADGGRAGLRQSRLQPIDVVISDVRMPDIDGLDVIRELRALADPPDVISITAFGSIETAIQAMRLGAADYITKPFEIAALRRAIDRVLRERGLRQEVSRLRRFVAQQHGFANMIGKSPAMQRVFELIRRVADSNVTVLITGDSGTGKEMVARALHFNGVRRNQPFCAVNCAAIAQGLLESELFGYRRGAFTGATVDRPGLFQEANHGTLFLDEVSEIAPSAQAKLLRALQEREVLPVGAQQPEAVDVRVIAATNRSLSSMIDKGEFRRDLYYRLNVVQIELPALRQRKEDILPLATHLLAEAAKKMASSPPTIAPQTAKALLAYDWPGNVRELQNAMERALALNPTETIEAVDLPREILATRPQHILSRALEGRLTLAELERQYILQVLDEESGNKSRAAQRLGLDRKTLYRKLEEYRSRSDRCDD